MKRALVTLAIGDKYRTRFEDLCRASWSAYAQRNDLALVVLTETLDESSRAQSRSPAWQKCLVLSQDALRGYEQVAWVDADILINPCSPSVFDGVPPERIGAVDAQATPNVADNPMWTSRMFEYWAAQGADCISTPSATEYHRAFGFSGSFESIVQTGVLVLSPRHHRELLEHVYYNYEDRGDASWNYEMRPLSYEILTRGLAHWMSPRFNMPWLGIKLVHYPFLLAQSEKGSRPWLGGLASRWTRQRDRALAGSCATTAYLNNYFLHFAACGDDMERVNTAATSVF